MSERVSKETLAGLITGFEMQMQEGMGEEGVENILAALKELLERREADTECPYCGEFHDRGPCDVPDMKA